MYSEIIEELIDAALADGVLTDKERAVLKRRAVSEGIDPDEFDMVLDARLARMQKSQQQAAAAAKPAKPKSDKYGKMRKCPACGAMLKSFSGVCPECGYEITGVSAASSLQTFYKDIKKADYHEKDSLIKSLPVPNTNEELFEVMNMAVSCATSRENTEAWISKAGQVYQKITLTCDNNPAMLNRATDMIISLMKRMPKTKRNFTMIPPSMQSRVDEAMKERDSQMKKRIMRAIGVAIAIPVIVIILMVASGSSGQKEIALLLMCGVIPSAIGGVYLCRNMINNAKEDMILKTDSLLDKLF